MNLLSTLLPGKARRWVFIGFAILALCAIAGRLLSRSGMMTGLLVGLGAIAAILGLWLLIHFAMRFAKRKRQREFDATIAAREGIEDRRREWQSWVEELERNDIDRYALPFYLLVGEPQSGKSILLQNSDLRFLFGQSRLSGIGGTRGCDWWFTEEAVILDLAGRLFTHEGGASDEAEWDAFLDLLNGFRPMDPANGIMLVIPCDSLLGDSIEVSGQKAAKIREALLTLTRKLEAKIPIYAVLTKGDKIFGFAETVHRLSVEQRQQMFGWSRSADAIERPMEPQELRDAWAEMVERGRVLRDTMLSTARIPEALPEVDRMMSFPQELEGLLQPLEVYLDRIFQGSELVEQLYFRGVYLTSGLQAGAPIAKVALDILDRPGEADNRDLETLFVRPQAYFIKDLIRKRVFGERGLVRPTSARVERSQKQAKIAYGVAAGLAVTSLAWGIYDIQSDYKASGQPKYAAAIDAGRALTKEVLDGARDPELGAVPMADLLADLDKIEEGLDHGESVLESLHTGREDQLVTLYRNAYDSAFRHELQDTAAKKLAAETLDYGTAADSRRPAGFAAFIAEAETARLLNTGFADDEEAQELATFVGEIDVTRFGERHTKRTGLEGAGFEPALSRVATSANTAAKRALNSQWDATLDPADSIRLDGGMGELLCWFGLTEARDKFAQYAKAGTDMGATSEDFDRLAARSLMILGNLGSVDSTEDIRVGTRTLRNFVSKEGDLVTLRRDLRAPEPSDPQDWKAYADFRGWLVATFPEDTAATGVLDGAADAVADLADSREVMLRSDQVRGAVDLRSNPGLRVVLRADWLGAEALVDLDTLRSQLTEALKFQSAESTDAMTKDIVTYKLARLDERLGGSSSSWGPVHTARLGDGEDGVTARIQTLDAVISFWEAVKAGNGSMDRLASRLQGVANDGVIATGEAMGTESLSTDGIRGLNSAGDRMPSLKDQTLGQITSHVAGVRTTLANRWADVDRSKEALAKRIAADANALDAELASAWGAAALPESLVGQRWHEEARIQISDQLKKDQAKVRSEIATRADLGDLGLRAAVGKIESQLIGGDSKCTAHANWYSSLPTTLTIPAADDRALETFFKRYADDPDKFRPFRTYRLTLRRGDYENGETPPRRFRRDVQRVADVSGPDLAAAMGKREFKLGILEDDDDPRVGLDREFIEQLDRSFAKVLDRQLRTDYLVDLERLMKDSSAAIEMFWHDRWTATNSKGFHHENLERLFGYGSKSYLYLLDRYQLLSPVEEGQESADFRARPRLGAWRESGGESLTEEENAYWLLDAFLMEMALYVRDAASLAELNFNDKENHTFDKRKLFVEIAVRIPNGQATSSWGRYTGLRSERLSDNKVIPFETRNGRFELVASMDDWDFTDGQGFDLLWFNSASRNQESPYTSPTSLEPLLLFWSDQEAQLDTNSAGRVEKSRVKFEYTKDEFLPFDLRITPAPPRRPPADSLSTILNLE